MELSNVTAGALVPLVNRSNCAGLAPTLRAFPLQRVATTRERLGGHVCGFRSLASLWQSALVHCQRASRSRIECSGFLCPL